VEVVVEKNPFSLRKNLTSRKGLKASNGGTPMLKKMNPEEYVEAWNNNAMRHFDDGDYEWICDQIPKYNNVLEIGCGSGYSTLVLLLHNHKVLSVECNKEAIQTTKKLAIENGYEAEIAARSIDFEMCDAWLWNIDAVGNRESIIQVVNQLQIDLILLCNPGGNLDSNLRMYEVKLLKQYGFSQDEINQYYMQGAIHLLHKFSIIDAAADIAIKSDKPLFIVERGSRNQVGEMLDQIKSDTHMRKVFDAFREIRCEPEGGIKLGDADGKKIDKMFWGAGMFFPM